MLIVDAINLWCWSDSIVTLPNKQVILFYPIGSCGLQIVQFTLNFKLFLCFENNTSYLDGPFCPTSLTLGGEGDTAEPVLLYAILLEPSAAPAQDTTPATPRWWPRREFVDEKHAHMRTGICSLQLPQPFQSIFVSFYSWIHQDLGTGLRVSHATLRVVCTTVSPRWPLRATSRSMAFTTQPTRTRHDQARL